MPTAAKTLAALCLAVLGYIVSEMIKTEMPESTGFGRFSMINAALGFLVGWLVVGKRAGRGMVDGVANGLTGVVVLVFWGLFLQAAYEMFSRSMQRRFDGPVEAFAAVFEIGIEYAAVLGTPAILVALFIGALVTGYVTEYAARHWR